MPIGRNHSILKQFDWKSKIQCPSCGNHYLLEEVRVLEDYDEKIHRRMSYKSGDLICPKCDTVIITREDIKHFEEYGQFPAGHFITDGKKKAY